MSYALVIEDDEVSAEVIIAALQRNGFSSKWAETGRDGLALAIAGGFDAITLDRMLPDFDGLTIVSTLRSLGIQTPVLMISALSDVDERVKGLRAGGDDYLTKPFSPVEMLARLDALLRRTGVDSSHPHLSYGNLRLDLIEHKLTRNDEHILLLPTEFKLIAFIIGPEAQETSCDWLIP